MQRPALKPFLNVFRRAAEDRVYLGMGPEKTAIEHPTPEMLAFLDQLDGRHTVPELVRGWPDAAAWVAALDDAGVLEDRACSEREERDPRARRWSRQISYLRLYERPGWSGFDGQRRLAAARVVVAGVGAGGSTVLRILNTTGIGTLEAIDFDSFELDNLATHPAIDEDDVGKSKVDAMEQHLLRQNRELTFVGHRRRIASAEDLAELVSGADFFVPAFDHPRGEATRWANRAGLMTGVPFGVIGLTDKGAAAGPVVIPGETPCLECVGLSDDEWLREPRGQPGMGPLVAMLAGMLANEIVKVVSGSAPSALAARNVYINTGTLSFAETRYERRAGCVCAQPRPAAA